MWLWLFLVVLTSTYMSVGKLRMNTLRSGLAEIG